MSGTAEVLKWGQQSYVSKQMLNEIDREVVERDLIRSAVAACENEGFRCIDGTATVEIVEPVLYLEDGPQDCMVARVTVRCVAA